MNCLRVNAKIDRQQELTYRWFFITQDLETGHSINATFKLQLGSRDNSVCLCSNAKGKHGSSLFSKTNDIIHCEEKLVRT